jgi:pimeloyl-ACP methyl ester carboxylesterase
MVAVLAIGYAPYGRFVTTLDFAQARRWWYQWYMNAPGGAERVAADPIGFARRQWDDWSPAGWYDGAAFKHASESFRTSDWVAITLHGYRSRWLSEPVDPRYDADAATVAATGRLRTPTLMIQGAADGCDPPSESAGDHEWFDGAYRREVLPGVGHFPGREAPTAVVDAFCAFRDGL